MISSFSPGPHRTCTFQRIRRSIENISDLSPSLHSHYRNFTGSNSTFQHRFNGLLFFVHLSQMSDSIPFPVPIILSFIMIPLGAWLCSCKLGCARQFYFSHNMVFHNKYSYFTTLTTFSGPYTFPYKFHIDALIRRFVSTVIICAFSP